MFVSGCIQGVSGVIWTDCEECHSKARWHLGAETAAFAGGPSGIMALVMAGASEERGMGKYTIVIGAISLAFGAVSLALSFYEAIPSGICGLIAGVLGFAVGMMGMAPHADSPDPAMRSQDDPNS